jgi:hypothetical protein
MTLLVREGASIAEWRLWNGCLWRSGRSSGSPESGSNPIYATTFVIAHRPFRSNRQGGHTFSWGMRGQLLGECEDSRHRRFQPVLISWCRLRGIEPPIFGLQTTLQWRPASVPELLAVPARQRKALESSPVRCIGAVVCPNWRVTLSAGLYGCFKGKLSSTPGRRQSENGTTR